MVLKLGKEKKKGGELLTVANKIKQDRLKMLA